MRGLGVLKGNVFPFFRQLFYAQFLISIVHIVKREGCVVFLTKKLFHVKLVCIGYWDSS